MVKALRGRSTRPESSLPLRLAGGQAGLAVSVVADVHLCQEVVTASIVSRPGSFLSKKHGEI